MSVPPNSRLLRLSSVLPLILLAVGYGYSQTTPVEMRYKLTAGDRLVYREVFDREGKSPDSTFHAQVVLTNQLVVVDEAAGRFLVGVQRNRQSAELLESHERGQRHSCPTEAGFAQTMAKRPVRFYDTNLFATTGQMLLPPQVLREPNSKLLYGIKEIMPLPVTPIQVGSEWEMGVFGLRMKLERFESVRTESCAVFVDTGTRKDTHLQFTFCPESGNHITADNLIDLKTRNVKRLRLLLRPELFHSTGPVRIQLNGKEQPAVELKRDCQLFLRNRRRLSRSVSRLHR
jgi:hypothetical protein